MILNVVVMVGVLVGGGHDGGSDCDGGGICGCLMVVDVLVVMVMGCD